MPKRSKKSKKLKKEKKAKTKNRPMMNCYCTKCDGKLVESRTFRKHAEEEKKLQTAISATKGKEKAIDSPTHVSEHEYDSLSDSAGSSQIMHDDDDYHSDEEFFLKPVGKRRRRYDRFQKTSIKTLPILDEETIRSDSSDEEDSFDETSDSDDDENPFSAPESSYDSDQDVPTNMQTDCLWILIWIFKYQERFKLSDVAINSLIGFFSLVLKDADANRFNGFPSTAYMARKSLEIKKKSKNFAVCTDCNKLYNIDEISPNSSTNINFSGFKCTNVEFLKHPMKKQRKPCGSELLMKVPANNSYIWRPKMIFPLPCIKTQLTSLYNRPKFEELLRKWTNRDVVTDVMTDIYDGNIWKEFPSSISDQNHSKFFTPEMDDSNLGIMINLDWFQPFDSSVYSCGVIYGVICNLPRNVRFKKEYMLTLGLLPGSNEVKLDRINHYLAPIVDELLELWNGADLTISGRHSTVKRIRLAVICCSNDIPAARKLCGHISALVGCHRCYKRASGEEGQRSNFGGFDDIDEWFKPKDISDHRTYASIWKHQLTKEDRKNHVSRTHVRWSELLRLPYFDPIRFLVVDPMHNLFLGIAHWIVKRLWIDSGKIEKADLELMEKRANGIKIPSDLERIPHKIAIGEGFFRFTADQWKIFIIIYATPIM